MKTIGGICLCLLLTIKAQSQHIEPTHTPYGLDSVSWQKANEIWSAKCSIISILTTDSIVHSGQLLAVTDSALVLYEDERLFDPSGMDSLLHYYRTDDISAIFAIDSVEEVSRAPICAVLGGAVGTVVGTGLHVFLPGNTFHPAFIVPACGAGIIVGAGLGTTKSDTILPDTIWICRHERFKDTAAPGESELIWSTYDYTIWRDSIPESVRWTGAGIEVDSVFTFDDLRTSSPEIKRAFPDARVYATVSGKFMATKYEDVITTGSLFLFNAGYRMESWLLDAYYSENSSVAEIQSPVRHKATIDGHHLALSCSYIFVKHDRFNVRRFQCSAGLGIAYSIFDFYDAVPGFDRWYANVFGVMGKADLSAFLSQRVAIVLDVRQTILKTVVLPSCDWCQPQTTSPEPGEAINPSYFQFGLGVRFHL